DDVFPPAQALIAQRIYNIMHGCIMRPMPWDHPNFTGSNPSLISPLGLNPTGPSEASALYNVFSNVINSPIPNLDPSVAISLAANRTMWDVDNDGDGIPDSIWIDP